MRGEAGSRLANQKPRWSSVPLQGQGSRSPRHSESGGRAEEPANAGPGEVAFSQSAQRPGNSNLTAARKGSEGAK